MKTEPPIPLLPCPFCGASAGALSISGHFRVYCGCCGSSTGVRPGHSDTAEAAAEAWNTRVNPTPDPVLVVMLESIRRNAVAVITDSGSQKNLDAEKIIEVANSALALLRHHRSPEPSQSEDAAHQDTLSQGYGAVATHMSYGIYRSAVNAYLAVRPNAPPDREALIEAIGKEPYPVGISGISGPHAWNLAVIRFIDIIRQHFANPKPQTDAPSGKIDEKAFAEIRLKTKWLPCISRPIVEAYEEGKASESSVIDQRKDRL